MLTFGPGALIEGKNGPRMIPSLNHGLGRLFSSQIFDRFAIDDSRLRIALKNLKGSDARVLSLPSNASLHKGDFDGIYATYIFPVWRICHGRRGQHPSILYDGWENEGACPICNSDLESTAVRFVAACVDGHLDDVDWHYAVHRARKDRESCYTKYYYWRAGGSGLADIEIECHDCGTKVNMGEVYSTDFRCSGRLPEREIPIFSGRPPPFYSTPRRPNEKNCQQGMKVIQRQSTSLRSAETMTLLTIPEYDSTLSHIIQKDMVFATLNTILTSPPVVQKTMGVDEIINWIKNALSASPAKIANESIDEILSSIRQDGVERFRDLFNSLYDSSKSFDDCFYEEFASLLAGPRTTENFSMSSPETIPFEVGIIRTRLDVYPIERIRTVTAQTSYIRQPYSKKEGDPNPVSSATYLDRQFWYPGYEGLGEALFITFHDRQIPDFSNRHAHNDWKDMRSAKSNNRRPTLYDHIPTTASFVWLHTLAHAIIRALSLQSGYSSASLRERIYVDKDCRNGGFLIYVTSSGEDGGMGGLVSLAYEFGDIMRMALDGIRYCSNDPLCFETRKTARRVNGAACYSCLLLSETSCEHRNMKLDRHMIIGD